MSHSKYLFKILVLGDSGVGKSCLLMRFADDKFSGKYLCTVGVDFMVRSVEVAGQPVKLQLWDTAGEERFRAMLPSYFRSAHGVLLVYDTTSAKSFRSIDCWLEEIQLKCPDGVNVMLVGNKCDDLQHRQVSLGRGAHYADRQALRFREVSAKSGANVSYAFGALAVDIFNRLVACAPAPDRLTAGQDEKDKLENNAKSLVENENVKLAGKNRLRAKKIESCC